MEGDMFSERQDEREQRGKKRGPTRGLPSIDEKDDRKEGRTNVNR